MDSSKEPKEPKLTRGNRSVWIASSTELRKEINASATGGACSSAGQLSRKSRWCWFSSLMTILMACFVVYDLVSCTGEGQVNGPQFSMRVSKASFLSRRQYRNGVRVPWLFAEAKSAIGESGGITYHGGLSSHFTSNVDDGDADEDDLLFDEQQSDKSEDEREEDEDDTKAQDDEKIDAGRQRGGSLRKPNYFEKYSMIRDKFFSETTQEMISFAFSNYKKWGFPHSDEIRPMSCSANNNSLLGDGAFAATLIDSLDTLAILGAHVNGEGRRHSQSRPLSQKHIQIAFWEAVSFVCRNVSSRVFGSCESKENDRYYGDANQKDQSVRTTGQGQFCRKPSGGNANNSSCIVPAPFFERAEEECAPVKEGDHDVDGSTTNNAKHNTENGVFDKGNKSPLHGDDGVFAENIDYFVDVETVGFSADDEEEAEAINQTESQKQSSFTAAGRRGCVDPLLLSSRPPLLDLRLNGFETNIRIIGGLLSAHFMIEEGIVSPIIDYLEELSEVNDDDDYMYDDAHAERSNNDAPLNSLKKKDNLRKIRVFHYDGCLVRLALALAEQFLPIFDTPTGIPYGTFNLKSGVTPGEIQQTSLSEAGTYLLEFTILSRISGDPRFERVAKRAARAIFNRRHPVTNLLGTHLNVTTGAWTVLESTIGSGIDSYLEYLVKQFALTGEKEFLLMFDVLHRGIYTYLRVGSGDENDDLNEVLASHRVRHRAGVKRRLSGKDTAGPNAATTATKQNEATPLDRVLREKPNMPITPLQRRPVSFYHSMSMTGADVYFPHAPNGINTEDMVIKTPEGTTLDEEKDKETIRIFGLRNNKKSVGNYEHGSLCNFYPGLLVLAGHAEEAKVAVHSQHAVWNALGAFPESLDIPRAAKDGLVPLALKGPAGRITVSRHVQMMMAQAQPGGGRQFTRKAGATAAHWDRLHKEAERLLLLAKKKTNDLSDDSDKVPGRLGRGDEGTPPATPIGEANPAMNGDQPQTSSENYPVRPEHLESLYLLYEATRDDAYVEMAAQVVIAIEARTRGSCGYGTLKDAEVMMPPQRLREKLEDLDLRPTATETEEERARKHRAPQKILILENETAASSFSSPFERLLVPESLWSAYGLSISIMSEKGPKSFSPTPPSRRLRIPDKLSAHIDRQESFVIAETLKYAFLIFSLAERERQAEAWARGLVVSDYDEDRDGLDDAKPAGEPVAEDLTRALPVPNDRDAKEYYSSPFSSFVSSTTQWAPRPFLQNGNIGTSSFFKQWQRQALWECEDEEKREEQAKEIKEESCDTANYVHKTKSTCSKQTQHKRPNPLFAARRALCANIKARRYSLSWVFNTEGHPFPVRPEWSNTYSYDESSSLYAHWSVHRPKSPIMNSRRSPQGIRPAGKGTDLNHRPPLLSGMAEKALEKAHLDAFRLTLKNRRNNAPLTPLRTSTMKRSNSVIRDEVRKTSESSCFERGVRAHEQKEKKSNRVSNEGNSGVMSTSTSEEQSEAEIGIEDELYEKEEAEYVALLETYYYASQRMSQSLGQGERQQVVSLDHQAELTSTSTAGSVVDDHRHDSDSLLLSPSTPPPRPLLSSSSSDEKDTDYAQKDIGALIESLEPVHPYADVPFTFEAQGKVTPPRHLRSVSRFEIDLEELVITEYRRLAAQKMSFLQRRSSSTKSSDNPASYSSLSPTLTIKQHQTLLNRGYENIVLRLEHQLYGLSQNLPPFKNAAESKRAIGSNVISGEAPLYNATRLRQFSHRYFQKRGYGTKQDDTKDFRTTSKKTGPHDQQTSKGTSVTTLLFRDGKGVKSFEQLKHRRFPATSGADRGVREGKDAKESKGDEKEDIERTMLRSLAKPKELDFLKNMNALSYRTFLDSFKVEDGGDSKGETTKKATPNVGDKEKRAPSSKLGDMSFPPIRLEEDPTPLFCPHPKGPLAKKIMSPRGDGDQIHLSRVFEWENNQPHDTSRGTGHNSRGAQQQEEPSLSSSTITIPNAIETPYEIRSREESECGDSCEDDDSYFESRISSEYLLIPTARSSME